VERRRLVRDIHDGAQQHLVQAVISLQLARSAAGRQMPSLAPLVEEALEATRAATTELRDLAAGLHPAILTHRGLAAAIRSLTARAPLPVVLDVDERRFPASLESTVYFIVAEALTNITKYAGASQARIRVRPEGDGIAVEVSDDGAGGADPSRGTGLRGLADRVAALDGRLELSSPRGAGTVLRAHIPLGEDGAPAAT
jgi:signal transduction histidine kinase